MFVKGSRKIDPGGAAKVDHLWKKGDTPIPVVGADWYAA